mgnify:CR=1 FL=1
MKNVISIVIAAVVLSLAVGCCACRKGKNNRPLMETEWQLVRMMGTDIEVADDQFVFQFSADGRFSGATRGASIGHVSPEAADGGNIALIGILV